MALAAAKAFSASAVAITDIRPGNLPVALELGATHALDQSQATSAADTVASLKEVFPEGPDIVIDCVGMSTTLTVSASTLQLLSLVPLKRFALQNLLSTSHRQHLRRQNNFTANA